MFNHVPLLCEAASANLALVGPYAIVPHHVVPASSRIRAITTVSMCQVLPSGGIHVSCANISNFRPR